MNKEINYVPIAGIKPLGRQPVYNMEVEQYHNFSVNGGIIVHNCMDAVRYFVHTKHLIKKPTRSHISLCGEGGKNDGKHNQN